MERIQFIHTLSQRLEEGLMCCEGNIYLQLMLGEIHSKMFVPLDSRLGASGFTFEKPGKRALCLQAIQLSPKLRGCGHFSKIMNVLEQRAKIEDRVLVVGPILQHAGRTRLPTILKSRGYENLQSSGLYMYKPTENDF